MLDFIVLFIIILFVLIGVLRGFIKEIFGVISFVCAILITVYNHDVIIQVFKIEKNLQVFNVISTICVFIISFLVIILIQSWIIHALSPIRLKFFDRFLGSFIGAFKGCVTSYLLLGVLNMYYYSLYYDKDNMKGNEGDYLPHWMKESISYSLFPSMDIFINALIPDDVYHAVEKLGDDFTVKRDELSKKNKKQGVK